MPGLDPRREAYVEALLDELRAQQHLRPPRAEICKVGRWTYRVSIQHGLLTYGPDGYGWRILGRRRAERKARRALGSYLRIQQRDAQQPTAVTVNDLTDQKEQP